MNSTVKYLRYLAAISFLVFFFNISVSAQDSDAQRWEKAQSEMKEMLGDIPVMFTKLPLYVRADAWEWFKSMSSPESTLPPKYGELIGLAVASQIPCDYCIYAHTEMAKLLGATDQEIQEAVMKAADIRHWSTILNGNQVDFESFKSEWDGIMAALKAKAK